MTPLVEVLTRTTEYFRQRGIPSARLDAELLVGHVLGLDRVGVYLAFDRPLGDADLDRIRPLVRRRGAREPLAWVLGEKEFYGHPFTVTSGVLVPRPDTETLVEALLEQIPAPAAPAPEAAPADPADADASEADAPEAGAGGVPDAPAGAPALVGEALPAVFVADIGSGSGCIGLTLALERPQVRLYAIDLSAEALACTRANVERHGLKDRVAVRRGDGLAAVPADRPLDWVVSNPPYIPTAAIGALAPEIRDHEPRLALDGGEDGLDAYRALIPVAARRARKGVLVEVGDGQADDVAALMEAAGLVVSRRADLTKVERVVIGLRP